MKVLIIKTSSLGDVLHTLPALTDAKKNIPEMSFDWVVEESFVEIPSWHSAVVNVIPISLRRWRKNLIKSFFSGEILRFFKTLRRERYDLIIDAQGLIKSAIVTMLAQGISHGYDKNSAREWQASLFYKNKYFVAKDQHAINRTRQLFAQVLQYEAPTTVPIYGIDDKIFSLTDVDEKYLVFCHGTSREEKCWSELKWIALTEFAINNGFIVYLPWGNEVELLRAKRIAGNHKRIRVLPKVKLTALASLFLSASGAVGVDTGLLHLAAALKTPAVALYGPTNPSLIGITGDRQNHLLSFNTLEAADVWQELKKVI